MKLLILAALLSTPASALTIRNAAGSGGIFISSAPGPGNPGAAPASCEATDPLAAACYPTLNHSQEASHVWFNDLSTKVFQNYGAAESTRTLQMVCARNERCMGQGFINVPAGGLTNLNVELTALTGNRSAFVISSQTISNPRGPFSLDVSSYTQISTLSAIAYSTNGYAGFLGARVPSAFMPKIDRYYGQETGVLPIPNLTAGENQGFLFTVFVPTHAVSDYYSGQVCFSTGTGNISCNPVVVEVLDFLMPSTSRLYSFNEGAYAGVCMMQYKGVTSAGCKAYNKNATDDNDGARIADHDHAVFMLDFRWTLGNINTAGDTAATAMVKNSHLFQGTTSSIWINPMLPGARLTTQKAGLQSANQATCTNWLSAVNGVRPAGTTPLNPFEYPCDEPSGAAQWGVCKSSSGVTMAVGCPSLITASYSAANTQSALDKVNALFPGIELVKGNETDYDTFKTLASSNTFGMYSACPSGASGDGTGPCNGPSGAGATGKGNGQYPNAHLDGRAINNQLMGWMLFRASATGELNSTIDYCESHNDCGGTGNKSSTKTWGVNGLWYKGQGDETWTLVMTSDLFPAISTPVVVALFNLVASAQGHQDYEYLMALQDVGGATAQVAWTAVNKFASNLDAINVDAYAPQGSYAGNMSSSRRDVQCAVHRITYPSGSCPI